MKDSGLLVAGSIVVGVVVFCCIVLFGAYGTNLSWTKDCDHIGAHQVDGVVYDCKRRGGQ